MVNVSEMPFNWKFYTALHYAKLHQSSLIFWECKRVPYCISYPPENMTDLRFVFWESCPGGGWEEDQGVNGLLARSWDFRVSWSNSRCGIHRLTFPSAAQSILVLYARTSRTILGLINKVTCLWLTQPLYTSFRRKNIILNSGCTAIIAYLPFKIKFI